MLSHPAFVLTLVRSDAQCKAFFTQQNVAAVCGVDGPDGVVLWEMNDISFILIYVCFGVQTSYKVIGLVAQILKRLCAHSGHDIHIQHNIDRIGQLNADFGEGRADRTHGVRNDVHGTAFHYAIKELAQFFIHHLGIFPVVGGACILFFPGADKGSTLYAGNVAGTGSVQQTAGKFFLVEFLHLAGGDCFSSQGFELLLAAINPDNLVRSSERDHLIQPF